MRNCNCGGGGGCACRILPGAGVSVSGAGTPTDPFVISASVTDFEGSIIGSATGSVTITVTGSGTAGVDPFVISAASEIGVMQLIDVVDPSGPNLGDTLVWNGAAFELAPPPTTPPGAVGTGAGLVGDGSVGNEIEVAVSDTTTTTTDGLGIYVDSEGQLRAVAPEVATLSWDNISGKPATFPPSNHGHSWGEITGKPTVYPTAWDQISGRPTISSAAPSGGSNGDVWFRYG